MYQSQVGNLSAKIDDADALRNDIVALLQALRLVDQKLTSEIESASKRLSTSSDIGALNYLVVRAGIALGLGT